MHNDGLSNLNTQDMSVLATLAYYDTHDFPLTIGEIERLCIPASHISESNSEIFGFNESLERLTSAGLIEEGRGFYSLKDRGHIYTTRQERQKIADQKWKKALKAFWWFQMIPYVRGVFASGSLAMSNTDEMSDWDALVVTKAGRIWTCRLLASLIMSIRGVRRTKYDTIAPDKVCLNHYITEDSLAIPFHSIYNAHTYAHLVPVWLADENLAQQFQERNDWVKNYLKDWKVAYKHSRIAEPSKFLRVVARTFETILNTWFGNVVENIARSLQKNRIIKDKAYKSSGGRITIDDSQLEFHPHSPEKEVVTKFNLSLQRFPQLSHYKESDSGLIQ